MRSDSINYLHSVGISFKSAESPDLWSYLENQVTQPHPIGHRFTPMSPAIVIDMIMRGENALLDSFVMQHIRDGKVSQVAEVIEMPFIVGMNGAVSIPKAHHGRILDLVGRPGTANEHIIHVVPTDISHMPSTHRVTVRGGLYSDGHTAGYYDLCPGSCVEDERDPNRLAWLTTSQETLGLIREMEENIDSIRLVSSEECAAMIKKACAALE